MGGSIPTPLHRRWCFSKRAMAEIGYTRLAYGRYRVPLEHIVAQRLRTTSHWSKPHRIRTQSHVHRVHPIMAEQVLDMYVTRIQATRLWPDYSTTSPHAHTRAQRARTRATSRGEALFVLSSRSSFFPDLSFRSSFLWTLKSQLGHFLCSRIPPVENGPFRLDVFSTGLLWSFFLSSVEPISYSYRQSNRFHSCCALPRGGWFEEVLLYSSRELVYRSSFLWLVRPRSAHAGAPNHSHSISDLRQRPAACPGAGPRRRSVVSRHEEPTSSRGRYVHRGRAIFHRQQEGRRPLKDVTVFWAHHRLPGTGASLQEARWRRVACTHSQHYSQKLLLG